jgi:hypothetical protein
MRGIAGMKITIDIQLNDGAPYNWEFADEIEVMVNNKPVIKATQPKVHWKCENIITKEIKTIKTWYVRTSLLAIIWMANNYARNNQHQFKPPI